jgi:hypothetical protein
MHAPIDGRHDFTNLRWAHSQQPALVVVAVQYSTLLLLGNPGLPDLSTTNTLSRAK